MMANSYYFLIFFCGIWSSAVIPSKSVNLLKCIERLSYISTNFFFFRGLFPLVGEFSEVILPFLDSFSWTCLSQMAITFVDLLINRLPRHNNFYDIAGAHG